MMSHQKKKHVLSQGRSSATSLTSSLTNLFNTITTNGKQNLDDLLLRPRTRADAVHNIRTN